MVYLGDWSRGQRWNNCDIYYDCQGCQLIFLFSIPTKHQLLLLSIFNLGGNCTTECLCVLDTGLDSVVRGGSRGNARGARGFQIPSSIPKQTTTKMWILFLSTKITCHTLLYSTTNQVALFIFMFNTFYSFK